MDEQSAVMMKAAYDSAMESAKALDRQLKRSVKRGMTFDYLNNVEYNNVVYPKDKIPDYLLRLVEFRNPVVGAVITLRMQQIQEFSNLVHDKDMPGWEVALKDPDETLTPKRKKQKQFLENMIQEMRVEDYEPITNDHHTFKEVFAKYVRDRILIDKVAWELERDRKGRLVSLWALDGATILPILPGGFVGTTSQIAGAMRVGVTPLMDKLVEARIEAIPPKEKICYIQELLYGTGGGIVAAFTAHDLLFSIKNERNDIRYYKQGFSVVEKANQAIIAFINSLKFNSNGLSRSAIPKVAVSMGKDSGYTTEQLEDMQDEWMANFEGEDGQWNIPILNGDAKILNLLPSNRDMEYQKYLEFTGALTAAVMGADLAETGLRFNQAQSVLSENQDAKQKFSKSRALLDLLGQFSDDINKVLRICGYDFARDFVFRFNGINPTDRGFEADLAEKKARTYKTIDEIRAENDLKPLEVGGNLILNPTYLQYLQAKEMQDQQGAEGDGGGADTGDADIDPNDFDDDINDMVDEAVDGEDEDEGGEEMQKAIRDNRRGNKVFLL
jgi:hypothetical protein